MPIKFTVAGFKQTSLLKFKLDANDAIIMRWLLDNSGELRKVAHSGKEYLWVQYNKVIEALPTLYITNKEVIARRFKKYVKCGLMESYVKRSGGTFTCYRFVPDKYLELFDDTINKNYFNNINTNSEYKN